MPSKTPSCKICNKLVVSANAGILKSIPYFYCRNCKIEVNDWGFEVESNPKPSEVLRELDDYLSGEIGRFEDEAPASRRPAPKTKIKLRKTAYDPFHKRNLPVEEEEPDEDLDTIFGDGFPDFEII